MSKKFFSRVIVQPHYDDNCFSYFVFGTYPDGDYALIMETTSEKKMLETVLCLVLRNCCDAQLDCHCLLWGY